MSQTKMNYSDNIHIGARTEWPVVLGKSIEKKRFLGVNKTLLRGGYIGSMNKDSLFPSDQVL